MSNEEEENTPASEPEAPASQPPVGRMLGNTRWVQLAFMVGSGLAFWFFDKLVYVIWNQFAPPKELAATGLSALLAVGLAFTLYRIPKYNRFVHEVVVELTKVTWPTREEAWAHTVTVIVVSIIAAFIVAIFDATWSKATDLIYGSSATDEASEEENSSEEEEGSAEEASEEEE